MTTQAQPSSQPTRLSRTLGALLGLHSGDSLGASLEFSSHATIRKQYPTGLRSIIGGGPFHWNAGDATDDTDLTRAVLLAYRDAASDDIGPSFSVVRRAGHYMLKWLDGDWPGRTKGIQPRDIGGATSIGLSKFRHDQIGGAGKDQAGNGSLMRCLATGLFVREAEDRDGERLVREAMGISRITHDDERCTIACAAYCAIVRALVEGRSAEVAVEEGLTMARRLEPKGKTDSGDGPVTKAIAWGKGLNVADITELGPTVEVCGESMRGQGGGYVLESLTLAVAAVLDNRSLEDVLVDIVRVGKDTDTNGAIAGGLLGARDGVDAIPKEWREKLLFAAEFEDIVKELLNRTITETET